MDADGHTSQFSRIKQRPPATALSGPKASAVSLTPRSSNLAVADAVDLQSDLFSSATVLGSALPSGQMSPSIVDASTLSEVTIRYSNGNKHVHVLSGSPPGRIEGVDGAG